MKMFVMPYTEFQPNLSYRFWHKKEKKYIDVVSLDLGKNSVFGIDGNEYPMEDGFIEPYIGLSDRNKKRIYVGDVLLEEKNGFKSKCRIAQVSDYHGYRAYYLKNENNDPRRKREYSPMYFGSMMENFTIIGNVHEIGIDQAQSSGGENNDL
jgi:hypothetical protein